MSPVARFRIWLAKNHPKALASFSGPGSKKSIASLERALGPVDTAASLVELHRTMGGQPDLDERGRLVLEKGIFEQFSVPTIDKIFATTKTLDLMAKVGEWDEGKTQWTSWWVPGWIPALESFSDDAICVDTVGSFGGAAGQLLEFDHESDERRVLAPSFDAWFETFVASLESGLWVVADGWTEPTKERALAKFFRERLPGYPLARKAEKVRKATTTKPAKAR